MIGSPATAAELVRRQVTVIVGTVTLLRYSRHGQQPPRFQSSSTLAATRSNLGLVTSLSRPGGNLTGVVDPERATRREATAAVARTGPRREHHCASRQPDRF